MATTIRGGASGGGGKEKRGTSPSHPVIKKSPKPSSSTQTSSSSLSSLGDEKNTSPTEGKPVPNYLRPTISSSPDSSRTSKKSEADSSKPVLNRRRSFDRPPPASQVQKAIRNVPGLHKPFRSSSFSATKPVNPPPSSGSTKAGPSSERPAAVKKDAKAVEQPRLFKSRSLKKTTLSSSTSLKKDADHHRITSSTTKKKAPRSVTSESSDYESRSSVDHLVIDDEMVNIDHEVESLPEISEMPESNKDLGDPIQVEVEVKVEDHHHDEEEKPTAPDQASDEPAPQESTPPELVLLHQEDQIVEKKEPEVEDNVEESGDDHQMEVEGAEHQNETGEDAGVEQETLPKADHTEVMAEEEQHEKEEEVVEREPELVEGEKTEAKEEIESVVIPSEETSSSSSSSAAAAVTAAPVRAAHPAAAKKENQAYNDVIEQTATKLMGGKKNKVLALAGAFETVISLQDTNNNSNKN